MEENINETIVSTESPVAEKLATVSEPVKAEVPEKELSLKEKIKSFADNTEKPVSEKKEAVTDEWKPNYKLKAYDKEFEVPEKFRAFINKDNEKEFKDHLEKAFAFDVMKEKNQKIRESNEQFKSQIEQEYAPKLQRYGKLESHLAKRDFDRFFEEAKVNEQELQQWMLKKLQLRDLPSDQQELYNSQRAAQLRAEQLEEENTSYKQRFETLNQRQMEDAVTTQLGMLDQAISSPEISSIAKNFDQRLGQDGAYKLEVLRRAAMLSKQRNIDIPVHEAIAEFNRTYGLQAPAPKIEQDSGEIQKSKPMLPSLNGKATSPAVQKIKSLDDVKKMAKTAMLQASRASRE